MLKCVRYYANFGLLVMNIDIFQSSYLTTLINITILNFIALASPGPDFAIVVKNSLVNSKKAGIMTALGIASGEAIHLSYILLGVGVIIAKSIWVLNTVKIIGALYLTYIGVKMIKTKNMSHDVDISSAQSKISLVYAFQNGLLANLLNPKAILFFLGVFTVVVDLNTPISVLLIYAVAMCLTTLIWFIFVALVFSSKKLRNKFINVSHWVERITGSLLILISIKLLLTKEY